jgi:predicted transglutaminase-like cysteine proteinase
MAASISPGIVATLASLFIVAPPQSGQSVETTPQAIVNPASGDAPARFSFPEPRFRALELPVTAPAITFRGSVEPVVIAEAEPSPATKPSASPIEEFPGAVPVSVPKLAANPKWRRVIDENSKRPRSADGSIWARWDDLVRKVSALQGEERLQAVNEGINTLLIYASDDEIYGVGDHWATLQESMSRGRGDCEDIAIAKMWLLNSAGVDLSSMRLVVLKDTLRNVDHAVLSVIENGHQYVLDNTAWKVGRADWMRGYRPIYALSTEESWIYGMRVPSAPPLQVAQSASPPLPQ